MAELKAAHKPAGEEDKVSTRTVKVPKRLSDGPKIYALCNFTLREEKDVAKSSEVFDIDYRGVVTVEVLVLSC